MHRPLAAEPPHQRAARISPRARLAALLITILAIIVLSFHRARWSWGLASLFIATATLTAGQHPFIAVMLVVGSPVMIVLATLPPDLSTPPATPDAPTANDADERSAS